MPVKAEDMSVPAAEPAVVGHHDRTPGYAVRRANGSPSWLMMWTQAGAGLVEQAGASCTTGPGDLVVLASGAAQHYRVAPGRDRWCFWWAHFQPRPSWSSWLAPYALAPGCHLVGATPAALHSRIDQAFRRAHRDARWLAPIHPALRPSPGGSASPGPPAAVPGTSIAGEPAPAVAESAPARELAMGALEEVLILATAAAAPHGGGTGGIGDSRVVRALALIAAEPGARHSVVSLAAAVALSPSRFAHLFTAETGASPMRAVRQARLRHAARLLEVTDLDVGRVAAVSGFASPFHFSRVFRREYGIPPREYRARLTRSGRAG